MSLLEGGGHDRARAHAWRGRHGARGDGARDGERAARRACGDRGVRLPACGSRRRSPSRGAIAYVLRGSTLTARPARSSAEVWSSTRRPVACARERGGSASSQAVRAADAQETRARARRRAAPRPLERASLAGRFALDAPAIARAADRWRSSKDAHARLGEHGWVEHGGARARWPSARASSSKTTRERPLDRGLPLETLRAKLAARRGARRRRARHPSSPRRDAQAIASTATSPAPAEPPRRPRETTRVGGRARRDRRRGQAGAGAFGVGEATGAPPDRGSCHPRATWCATDSAVQLGDLWFSRALVDGDESGSPSRT